LLPDSLVCVDSVEPVVDQQWVAQIQASYVPVQVTPGLWIIPDHCQPADTAAINVRLIPGVAFGTGVGLCVC
jgi:ribosomal protein L11 methyltransferase